MMKKGLRYAFLWGVLLLPYLGAYFLHRHYNDSLAKIRQARIILVSKQDMRMQVIDFKGEELLNIPIATGLNPGNKKQRGDMKTPEGIFPITAVEDASSWKHDFKDGKGEIPGAYGPYFIRLSTPGHQGIGIHGTHLNQSIGTRASEGCIRLRNEDLQQLISLIHPGMVTVIIPGIADLKANREQASKEEMATEKTKTPVKKKRI